MIQFFLLPLIRNLIIKNRQKVCPEPSPVPFWCPPQNSDQGHDLSKLQGMHLCSMQIPKGDLSVIFRWKAILAAGNSLLSLSFPPSHTYLCTNLSHTLYSQSFCESLLWSEKLQQTQSQNLIFSLKHICILLTKKCNLGHSFLFGNYDCLYPQLKYNQHSS